MRAWEVASMHDPTASLFLAEGCLWVSDDEPVGVTKTSQPPCPGKSVSLPKVLFYLNTHLQHP